MKKTIKRFANNLIASYEIDISGKSMVFNLCTVVAIISIALTLFAIEVADDGLASAVIYLGAPFYIAAFWLPLTGENRRINVNSHETAIYMVTYIMSTIVTTVLAVGLLKTGLEKFTVISAATLVLTNPFGRMVIGFMKIMDREGEAQDPAANMKFSYTNNPLKYDENGIVSTKSQIVKKVADKLGVPVIDVRAKSAS